MMDSKKAIAILALGLSTGTVALPQIKLPSVPVALPTPPVSLGTTTQTGAPGATASAGAGLAVNPVNGLLGVVPKPAGLPVNVANVIPPVPDFPAVNGLPVVGGLPIPPLPAVGGGLPVPLPPLPVVGGGLPAPIPPLPAVGGGLPVPIPPLPAVGGGLPIPALPLPIPKVDALPFPKLDGLPIPGVDALPLPDLDILSELASGDQNAAIKKIYELGTTVLNVVLGVLSKGLNGSLPKLPVPLNKRQLAGLLPVPTPAAAAGGILGSLPVVGGLTNNLPVVGGGSNPVASVPIVGGLLGGSGGSNPVASVPVVGGLLGGASGSNPVASVPVVGGLLGGSNPVASVPVVGGLLGGSDSSNPLAPVTNTVGGLTNNLPLPGVSGGNPLGAATGALGGVTGALGSVTGTVSTAVAGVPVVGGVANTAVNTVTGATKNLPVVGGLIPGIDQAPFAGIPNADPLGALSVSIIATLLSLLKKDPLSLFGGGFGGGLPLPIPALVKRDLPNLAERELEERLTMKRQLNLPSLSSGIPGVGVGALPLSGINGVNPDLAALVGSIAKNIAVPGGKGIGSITGNILTVLNGVVPNFLFKLPVVHDSVPTFGVLQLLSSINPAKFSALGGLTSLASLQQAVSVLPAADLAFIKGLPVSPDPSNLITTITALTDNLLTLPGNVGDLKAASAALSLKNLGLAVPGL